jgi:hypothetical protein
MIATEILCGLYEKPEIAKTSDIADKATFVSYNKWKDEVKYTYVRKQTKGAYFPSNIDPATINMDNFDELKSPSGHGDVQYRYVDTGKTVAQETTCSLRRWMEKGTKSK